MDARGNTDSRSLATVTLVEIGLYELRRSLERSPTNLAAELRISRTAISQRERGDDVKFSTLRSYLGVRLQISAIFNDDENETAIPIRLGAGA